MKKALLSFGLIPMLVFAQSNIFPVEEFYGGGVGYSPMYMALDSIPGSKALRSLGLNPGNFNSPFVIHGGEGFAHVAGRWRIGGYAGVGASRISTVHKVWLFVDSNDDNELNPGEVPELYEGEFVPSTDAKFTFSLGAATVEYVMPIFRDLEIATGALMGMGRVNLSVDQHNGTPRWKNAFINTYGYIDSVGGELALLYEVTDIAAAQTTFLSPTATSNVLSDVSGTFFNFQPYVAVKWQILDRVGLRISIGFNKGTIQAGRWYLNDREPISDSPKSALQGVAIRTMLYFGL